MCDCIERINEAFRENNSNAQVGLSIDLLDGLVRPLIQMEKIDTVKRSKLPVLAARHCPFCGVELKALRDKTEQVARNA